MVDHSNKIKFALQISLKLTSTRGELQAVKIVNSQSRARIIKLSDEINALTLKLQAAVDDLK